MPVDRHELHLRARDREELADPQQAEVPVAQRREGRAPPCRFGPVGGSGRRVVRCSQVKDDPSDKDEYVSADRVPEPSAGSEPPAVAGGSDRYPLQLVGGSTHLNS